MQEIMKEPFILILEIVISLSLRLVASFHLSLLTRHFVSNDTAVINIYFATLHKYLLTCLLIRNEVTVRVLFKIPFLKMRVRTRAPDHAHNAHTPHTCIHPTFRPHFSI